MPTIEEIIATARAAGGHVKRAATEYNTRTAGGRLDPLHLAALAGVFDLADKAGTRVGQDLAGTAYGKAAGAEDGLVGDGARNAELDAQVAGAYAAGGPGAAFRAAQADPRKSVSWTATPAALALDPFNYLGGLAKVAKAGGLVRTARALDDLNEGQNLVLDPVVQGLQRLKARRATPALASGLAPNRIIDDLDQDSLVDDLAPDVSQVPGIDDVPDEIGEAVAAELAKLKAGQQPTLMGAGLSPEQFRPHGRQGDELVDVDALNPAHTGRAIRDKFGGVEFDQYRTREHGELERVDPLALMGTGEVRMNSGLTPGDLRPVRPETADEEHGDYLALLRDAIEWGDMEAAEELGNVIAARGVPEDAIMAVFRGTQPTYATNDLRDRLYAIESSPEAAVFPFINRAGQLKKVNPKTGQVLRVHENGRLAVGRSAPWNLPGSGYDELAAEALAQRGGHSQRDGAGMDEFYEGALALWREARDIKAQLRGAPLPSTSVPAPAPAATPAAAATTVPVPVTPAAQPGTPAPTPAPTPASIPAAASTPVPATTPSTPRQRPAWLTSALAKLARTPDLAGALAGAGAGAQSERAEAAAEEREIDGVETLRAGASGAFLGAMGVKGGRFAKGLAPTREGTVVDPRALELAKRRAQDAMAADRGKTTGAKWYELPGEAIRAWRERTTVNPNALGQDAGTIKVVANEFGLDDRAMLQQRSELLDDALKHPGLGQGWHGPAPKPIELVGQGWRDLLTALGREDYDVAERVGSGQIVGIADGGKESKLSRPQRVLIEAAISSWDPRQGAMTPLAPALGAAQGYARPGYSAFIRTLNDLQHSGARLALAKQLTREGLAAAELDLFGKLMARGVKVKPAALNGGYHKPEQIEAFVAGATGDAKLAGEVAAGWRTQTQAVLDQATDRAAFLFGDFRNPGATEQLLDTVFPFSRWQMRYAPVLFEMAKRHPVVALGAVNYLHHAAQEAQEDGVAPWDAGTVPISTETPVLGAAARARLGGQSGTVRLNPLGMVLPYGAETLAPMAEGNGPPETPYQKVTGLLDRLGFGEHPLQQQVAYAAGWDSRPGALSRTAGLEQLGKLTAVTPGVKDALPDGGLMPSPARAVLDPLRERISGKRASDSDPVKRRAAELYLAETGRPIGDDPAAVAALDDLDNPYIQRALRESIQMAAAGNAASLSMPIKSSAQTGEAIAAREAEAGKPYSDEQVRDIEARYGKGSKQAQLYQNANARYEERNPAARTYDRTTGYGRGQGALEAWERENFRLKVIAPDSYARARRKKMEELGLLGR